MLILIFSFSFIFIDAICTVSSDHPDGTVTTQDTGSTWDQLPAYRGIRSSVISDSGNRLIEPTNGESIGDCTIFDCLRHFTAMEQLGGLVVNSID